MTPLLLLLGLLLLTAGAWSFDQFSRGRVRSVYRQLAVDYRMHYSPNDPLRLTPRVAARFPIPGAAAVRVIDLLYRTDEFHHYYVFTAEYTVGVIGPKHRIRRAAAFIEGKTGEESQQPIRLGDEGLSLAEQYRSLIGPSASSS